MSSSTAAGRFLTRDLPADTRIMVISGRGEFHNKGIDLFLEALARLNTELPPDQAVLAFLFVLGGYTDLIPCLKSDVKPDPANPPIATHRLQNEGFDPILQTCERLGLKNFPQNRVQVIFVPAYLNGHDGLINMPYYEALAGCDLGVFPSYYEPWGYTPLESAAYAVPTVTTDQAGFGLWAQQWASDCNGIILLKRLGQPDDGDRREPLRDLPEFPRAAGSGSPGHADHCPRRRLPGKLEGFLPVLCGGL